MADRAIEIRNLSTEFASRAGVARAVDNVSLHVNRGEILGLVGESGSGKSVTGYSIMRLIDEPGRITGGEILFDGVDLMRLSEDEMRGIRGAQIAMVFQDPMMTLNPVLRIGTQMFETLAVHGHDNERQIRDRCIEMLGLVGIPSPEDRLHAYPHELSGGMRQRIVIAMALLNRPRLVIADEPTTALDVTTQSQILEEVQRLCRELDTAMIWITHDMSVVAGLADRVCVMYAGQIVEEGSVDDVLDSPAHPYAEGLIRSVPSNNMPGQMLAQIRGGMPSLVNMAPGCRFASRCEYADVACAATIDLHETGPQRRVRCAHPIADVEAGA